MRGWYRPADGRWVDIGDHRGYDHAAALSDHDFDGILREVDGATVLLPGCVAPEDGDEAFGPHDLANLLGLDADDVDPNDAAVSLGWVRVNCSPGVTTGPYLHARSLEELEAGMAFVRGRGLDLGRPERDGFGGPFSGVVHALDVDEGTVRHAEYSCDRVRRPVLVREVVLGGAPPEP